MPIFPFRQTCRAVVVERNILAGIKSTLDVLLELWRREGADRVCVLAHESGAGNSPMAIRESLKRLDEKYVLEGVMLIGEIPVAYFEENYASRNILYTSDYFFMELQGAWTVAEANKVSSPHKIRPKICAGRVFVGSDTGISSTRPPVTEYYKKFLKKAIAFRLQGGPYRQGRKATVTSNLGGISAYQNHLKNLYPLPSIIDTHDGATTSEYEEIIETPYDWILYYGHSDSGQHVMAEGGSWNPFHYLQANIKINVFQFESCAVGAITWQTNSDPYDSSSPMVVKAMSDAFVSNILGNGSRGVIVLAPSIPGTFSNMDKFYNYLRSGQTFGEAFKNWMAREIDESRPHYMSFYGDPFLSFRGNDPSLYIKKRGWWERLADRMTGKGIHYF